MAGRKRVHVMLTCVRKLTRVRGQIAITRQMKFIEYFGDDINYNMAQFLEPLKQKLDE